MIPLDGTVDPILYRAITRILGRLEKEQRWSPQP